jgi:nicotinate dehydrogenase subunit B
MTAATTQDYLDRPDQLLVVQDGAEAVEIFVIVGGDGRVTAFNGHVDLGTGIGTALGQIVAEELDIPFDRVTVVLGDTARTPNQGPTIASETIQVTAKPLRQAAATARQVLLARAAERLRLAVSSVASGSSCASIRTHR